jgi:hypothetical protein
MIRPIAWRIAFGYAVRSALWSVRDVAAQGLNVTQAIASILADEVTHSLKKDWPKLLECDCESCAARREADKAAAARVAN